MDDKGLRPSEGSCIISEDVIATIASTAALEVPGVAGMAARPADIHGIMSTNAATKSVKVLNNENETIVDVYINSRLGTRIPDVAGMCSTVSRSRFSHDRQTGDKGQRARGGHCPG